MESQRAHTQPAQSTSVVPAHEQLGTNDRFFTLYQISGLLLSSAEKPIFAERLQQQFNIDPTRRGWSSNTISYQEMRYIFEHLWLGKNKDRSECLFNHASRINYASFGAISLAAMSLPSGEESIRFCSKHFQTPWSAIPEINRNGGISLLHIPRFYDPELRATLEHFHFVNCFAVSRSHTPGIRIAESVRFTRSCGIGKIALEHYFGCPVFFDEGIAQIDFSRPWLNRPMPPLSSTLRPQAEQQAAMLADHIKDKHSLLQFLQTHLDTIHSADDMARLLGISCRTLARILDQQGASYSILSREVRVTEARRLLRNGVTTQHIAERLGFSDERSFRCAFKSWSGSSPSEYRCGQEQFLHPLK
ncbi:MAG: helix-turn-helix domain-containing protein [Symbiopectobacterium sp.]|uniref:helix-turn-helix transcriptional regulator n=1 Tax=Symbiopectobacterium sp. TaxID=2952789 RepID=UPI0039E8C7D4